MTEWLPTRYDGLFDQQMEAVCAARPRGRQSVVTVFWPIRTGAYRRGDSLFVIGRAVNGWTKRSISIRDGNCMADFHAAKAQALESARKTNPLHWLALKRLDGGYQPPRSQFWSVVRQLVTPSADESQWFNRIAWSNLFKVAPHSGGNPGSVLRRAQQETASELLGLEIEALQPRRILFLAGHWWVRQATTNVTEHLRRHDGPFVQATGHLAGIPTVICCHPQGRPLQPLVNEITEAFGAL